jgi:hypothetical protein
MAEFRRLLPALQVSYQTAGMTENRRIASSKASPASDLSIHNVVFI